MRSSACASCSRRAASSRRTGIASRRPRIRPIGLNPDAYGIELLPPPDITFAHNDVNFHDPTGTDHDYLGSGLRKALYNYMHGIGLDADVREWFEPRVPRRVGGRKHGRSGVAAVPRTKVPRNLIESFLG